MYTYRQFKLNLSYRTTQIIRHVPVDERQCYRDGKLKWGTVVRWLTVCGKNF